MWKRLGWNEENFQTRHLYCQRCQYVIGTGKLPVEDCLCKVSGPGKPLSTVGFFVTLDLINQMERFFSIPNFVELLRYAKNRKKLNDNGIEDIFDGKMYKEMQKSGGFLSNKWNFSFTINTDGCQVANSSSVSAWPILLTINELPPHARKRFIIMAGVWVDKNHPDINTIMKPVVEQLRFLYNTGIMWKPNGVDMICSKFITIICCVDSVARSNILNMTRFNGKYGCPVCYASGRRWGDNLLWVYPDMESQLRTDREIRSDMESAMNSNSRIKGFIGNSILRYLPEFHLDKGVVIDSMHNMWLGVGKKLTLLLLHAKATDRWYIRSKSSFEKLINERLLKIRTPSKIARKPRGIENCKVWKASEWRNWILYYCVPCLKNLIPDEYFQLFCYLSEAAHILNNESVDNRGIRKARLLIQFLTEEYQNLMGLGNMTYNLHILKHVPDCVANWGPTWTHSAFIYEGYNRQIMLSLKSPNGRPLQIMHSYALKDFLREVKSDPYLDDEVLEQITDILNVGLKNKQLHNHEYVQYSEFRGLGCPIVREPSAMEKSLLSNEGLTCEGLFKDYNKATIRDVIYASEKGDNNVTQSCDKYVYTRGGLFARIDAIVSFVDNDNRSINGLFVTFFEIIGQNCGAAHLHELIEALKGFVTTEDALTPAIIMKTDNVMYGVKITNVWETD
ncbi:uncharacterized protein [Venturia canescens]|nr:uncharacterized protein LOC122417904 [Venturia canescens]